MGPTEELVRIAKKLDKMVARKNTVRRLSLSGQACKFARVCMLACMCIFACVQIYTHACFDVAVWLGTEEGGKGGGVCSSPPPIACGPRETEWVKGVLSTHR